MTTAFNELEKAHENKFQHDLELQFKAKARRNHLVGLWAPELLGLKNGEAHKYAEELVGLHIKDTGWQQIHHRILSDFSHRGVQKSAHQIERTIHELMAEADYQIRNE